MFRGVHKDASLHSIATKSAPYTRHITTSALALQPASHRVFVRGVLNPFEFKAFRPRLVNSNLSGSTLSLFWYPGQRMGRLPNSRLQVASYKRVKGRSHTAEKRISMHAQKPHATQRRPGPSAWWMPNTGHGLGDKSVL